MFRSSSSRSEAGHTAPPTTHLIELRQVTKTYTSAAGAFTAIASLDLHVDRGEFVAIAGKSGSGKSTLINLIAGIDRATTGEVLVGSTPVHTLDENNVAVWRSRTIRVIFQFFQLLPTLTALENVVIPMELCGTYTSHVRRDHALRLLEQMELAEHAHKLPSALSGGQHQRVAIARALANDVVIPDFNAIRLNKIWPQTGAWPPADHEILVERAGIDTLHTQVGGQLLIKSNSGPTRELRLAGLAHDITQPAPTISGRLVGYVTPETLAWLGQTRAMLGLNILVDGNPYDHAQAESVIDQVKARVQSAGQTVDFTDFAVPGRHPAADDIASILVVMGGLGFLALLLSGFLVINAISALLAQQRRQIGVLKALGARSGQVIAIYCGMILVLGLLALAVALPLGALGAYGFTQLLAGLANVDIAYFSIPLEVLALQVALCLAVPLLAALLPILAGTSVTVHEAIANHGIETGQFGGGRLDRLLLAITKVGPPTPTQISLRNIARRKRRLALTLIALALSGMTYIAVLSLDVSRYRRAEEMLSSIQYDIEADLGGAYRVEDLTRTALNVPGVASVEAWGFGLWHRTTADGSPGARVGVAAPPAATGVLRHQLIAGRWLRPDDTQAIVVDARVLKDNPDMALDHDVVLLVKNRPTTWRVVGVIQSYVGPGQALVNYPAWARAEGRDSADILYLTTTQHDAAFQKQVAQTLTAQDIAAAQATFEEARANLAKLLAGPGAADLQAAQAALDQANSTLQSQRDSLSAAKTNAQLQLEQRANDLIIAQSTYATARQRWHDVQGDSRQPSPVYEAYVQAEAELHSAEAAVKQAQVDYDAARQAEVTGIATTEAQVRSAQAALDKLRAGPTSDRIAAAKAQLANAESAQLHQRGEQRAGSIDAASAGIANARAKLDELVATPRPIDLASALAQVRQDDVAVTQAELALEQATLTAPFAGTVVSVNIVAGEPPSTSTPAFVLADISSWWITTTDLAERNAVRIQVGDAATITFDALPGVSLPGAVADMGLIGENKQGEMTYTVTIVPKQRDVRLRWNMTASVAIDAK